MNYMKTAKNTTATLLVLFALFTGNGPQTLPTDYTAATQATQTTQEA